MTRRIDLTGQRFNLLTVIEYAGLDDRQRALWRCRCDCGGEKVAQAAEMKRGNTRSCGCLARAQRQQAGQSRAHAYSRKNWPREYSAWHGMIRRCTDPKWHQWADYGGRGIVVCDRWRHSLQAFIEDMGAVPEGGSLDRIDNALGYSPENCRWATCVEQSNNRRSNRLLTYQGKTMNVNQWAATLGIRRQTLYQRLHKGWSVERVLGHQT